MIITFSGLDGAGKSTQIERLTRYIEERGLSYRVLTMYDDVSLSGFLRRFLRIRRKDKNVGKKASEDGTGSGEEAQKVLFEDIKSGEPKSQGGTNRPKINPEAQYRLDKNYYSFWRFAGRMFVYVLDAVVLRVKASFANSKYDVVVFDRYIYDSAANLFAQKSNWFVRAYARFLGIVAPRPDFAIFLSVEPKDAFVRKPEYPFEYVRVRAKAYEAVFKTMKRRRVFVEAAGDIEEVAGKIRAELDGVVGNATKECLEPVIALLLGAFNDDWKRRLIGAVSRYGWSEFKAILWENRVPLRAANLLDEALDGAFRDEIAGLISEQTERKSRMLAIMKRFQSEYGRHFVFIKTPDNYPDFGHDIDILTLDDGKIVSRRMAELGLEKDKQTVAEGIADKINFRYPDSCSIEAHCARIGEFGEHRELALYLLASRVKVDLDGAVFDAPDYVGRALLVVLQRFYRHFNLRVCDVVNVVRWIKENRLDVGELRETGRRFGIGAGVDALLAMANGVYKRYVGAPLLDGVKACDGFFFDRKLIRFNRMRFLFLMFGKKLVWDVLHLEFRQMGRELLFLPMAVASVFMLKVFKREGIW